MTHSSRIFLLVYYLAYSFFTFPQHCSNEVMEAAEFIFITQPEQFETWWYDEWCMKVYSTYIGFFGTIDKINKHFDTHFKSFEDIELYHEIEKYTPEFKNKFREMFMTTEDTREEIQNSFSIGKDGVYIVSNYALYKLRFNEENKRIELDPK